MDANLVNIIVRNIERHCSFGRFCELFLAFGEGVRKLVLLSDRGERATGMRCRLYVEYSSHFGRATQACGVDLLVR